MGDIKNVASAMVVSVVINLIINKLKKVLLSIFRNFEVKYSGKTGYKNILMIKSCTYQNLMVATGSSRHFNMMAVWSLPVVIVTFY